MKFRPYVVAVAALATAAFSVTVVAPADAAATDPVTGLSVTQKQVGSALQLTATWDANPDASAYRVTVTGEDSDDQFAVGDTTATTRTITTDSLAAGVGYRLNVRTTTATATAASYPFTAIGLDTTAPTGTYTLNRTSGYMTVDFGEDDEMPAVGAPFVVTQTGLSDDTTAAAAVTRAVLAGDGSPAQPWTGTGPFTLVYSTAGTFHPTVRLTDEFGNARDVALPTVTAKEDKTDPRVRITVPAKATKIASWKRIRGTATDTGTGVAGIVAFAVQKRGKVWYEYDFGKETWVKGYTDLNKTLVKLDGTVQPALMEPKSSGTWQTPSIVGLRKGKLHVEALAYDGWDGEGWAPPINRTLK